MPAGILPYVLIGPDQPDQYHLRDNGEGGGEEGGSREAMVASPLSGRPELNNTVVLSIDLSPQDVVLVVLPSASGSLKWLPIPPAMRMMEATR